MVTVSIATRSFSIRVSNQVSTSETGIATASPAAVVKSATQMPPARRDGSTALPAPCNCRNASIMPSTVPNRPSSGAIWAMASSARNPRCNACSRVTATRPISSSITALEAARLAESRIAVARAPPTGEGSASAIWRASPTLP